MTGTFSQLPSFVTRCFLLRSQLSAGHDKMLSVEQVPDVLKEPYIFTGYRPIGKPWKYYFFSMLNLHNETVNVWTHAVGFFVVLFRLMDFFSAIDVLQDKVAWPVLGFGACCLLSLVLSAAAHLLHSRSLWHHFLFFLMDYMGVTFYTFGSGIISMFTCSSKGYHDALQGWFLPASVILGWFSFYACCLAKTHLSHDNTKRKSLMIAAVTLQGMFAAMPVLTRYWECLISPACNFQSLHHITKVFFTLFLCGITFGGSCPESWLPGCFDILGHGHQIFHVLSVIVMIFEIRAVDIEVNIIHTDRDLQPDLTQICLAFMSLFLLEIATIFYYVFFREASPEIPEHDLQNSLLSNSKTEVSEENAEDQDTSIKKYK
uniref:Uncharacterized protein n=1 Tax=Arion vulgaris TaxID=1028688 RepID=A0A0B6ZW68_9EUPU